MGALSSTGSSFGSAAASTRLDQHPTNGSQAAFIDDVLKQQALAEEEAVLNQYKVVELIILTSCCVLFILKFDTFCTDKGTIAHKLGCVGYKSIPQFRTTT